MHFNFCNIFHFIAYSYDREISCSYIFLVVWYSFFQYLFSSFFRRVEVGSDWSKSVDQSEPTSTILLKINYKTGVMGHITSTNFAIMQLYSYTNFCCVNIERNDKISSFTIQQIICTYVCQGTKVILRFVCAALFYESGKPTGVSVTKIFLFLQFIF